MDQFLSQRESSKPWSTNGSSVYRSLKTLVIWLFSVKNLRASTISGGHTWHWMVFDLMMSIMRKSRRSRNVTQERFRVISNIINSRKHGSLGIGLKKLRSLRTRLGFHVGLTHGKSVKTSNIEAQLFHFDWVYLSEGFCSLTHTWIFSFQRAVIGITRFFSGPTPAWQAQELPNGKEQTCCIVSSGIISVATMACWKTKGWWSQWA